MSFFSKMKERLTRSSSKIDEGLQAIVEEEVAEVTVETVEEVVEETPKVGIVGRMLGRDAAPKRVLDDAMLESLEELLISADMGVETALKVSANMAEGRFGKKLGVEEIKTLLADEVKAILEPVARPMPLYAKKPQVVLVVGVNGSGKTGPTCGYWDILPLMPFWSDIAPP